MIDPWQRPFRAPGGDGAPVPRGARGGPQAPRDLPVGRARVRLSVAARQRSRLENAHPHRADAAKLVEPHFVEVSDPPDRIDVVEGVELDYGSNELAVALRGAIKGNGNFLERFLGDLALGGDLALLEEARAVVRPLLSRRVARHYGGFAMSQLKAFDDKATAKRALYVIRTAATGRTPARARRARDRRRADGRRSPEGIAELLAIKRSGEVAALPARARRGVVRAARRDDLAGGRCRPRNSVLPAEPTMTLRSPPSTAWLVGRAQETVLASSWHGRREPDVEI